VGHNPALAGGIHSLQDKQQRALAADRAVGEELALQLPQGAFLLQPESRTRPFGGVDSGRRPWVDILQLESGLQPMEIARFL
jgi:hypothetical protein